MKILLCVHCRQKPVVPPHRLHCSESCVRAYNRAHKSQQNKEDRHQILINGYEEAARVQFDQAQVEIQSEDGCVYYYRAILDLIDGQPTRVPFNPEQPIGVCRSISFPEPNRCFHVDTLGHRRRGDYFQLRHPFERPAVPLAAFYRIQFLGVMVLGKPLIVPTKRPLYVYLPPCPFVSKAWRLKTWGSMDLPLHRRQQRERKQQEKDKRQPRTDPAPTMQEETGFSAEQDGKKRPA